jgi:hypothetical protein
VEGCYADLKGLRDYHLRYKICEYHLKVSAGCWWPIALQPPALPTLEHLLLADTASELCLSEVNDGMFLTDVESLMMTQMPVEPSLLNWAWQWCATMVAFVWLHPQQHNCCWYVGCKLAVTMLLVAPAVV